LSNLELTGGARYTHEKKFGSAGYTFVNPSFAAVFPLLPVGTRINGRLSEGNVSPEATLTWHPQRNVTIYGAFKTGYKSGGFGNPTILPAGTQLSDLLFKHETATGGEIGVKASLLGGRLSGDLTFYRYDYKKLQVTAFNAATTSFFIQNAASARTQGVDAQIAFQATRALNLRAAVGYSHARYLAFPTAECWTGQTEAEGCSASGVQDLSGRPLARAPDFVGSAGFTYEQSITDRLVTSLTSDVRYTSGYYLDAPDTPYGRQDGFVTVDASLRLREDGAPWELAVIGRNLSNKYYGVVGTSTPGSPAGEFSSVVARARQVSLQGTYRF
jgi:iron complex outermembrane recepter protein